MTMMITPELLPDGAKGLVLDCDGTLMDTMSQHWTSWRLACAKFGVKMTVQQFIGYMIICCVGEQTCPAVLRTEGMLHARFRRRFAGKPGSEIIALLCEEQVSNIRYRQTAMTVPEAGDGV